MTNKTRKALLKSIEHWRQNLDMLILNHLSGSNLCDDIVIDRRGCALCFEFWTSDCKGCPIEDYFGSHQCDNDVYYEVDAWYNGFSGHTGFESGYEAISGQLELLYHLLYEGGACD